MAPPTPMTPGVIASAKADLAVALTRQFQDDINQLRDALDSANQLVALLRTENATLKGALRDHVEDYDFDASAPARPERSSSAAGGGLLRPPPEGTIFSNGGACGRKAGRGNKQLMHEVNRWTQAHGYKVKIFRSKPAGTKLKLTICCVYGGSTKDLASRRAQAEAEVERARAMGFHAFVLPDPPPQPPQQQVNPGSAHAPQGQPPAGQADGGDPQVPARKPRKKMTPRRKDCPMRFTLQELVAGSGTFVVRHSEMQEHQRCNHEPTVKFVAEASAQNPGSDADADADADMDGEESGDEE